LGRSRGGFTTKIHLICDRHGHPLQFRLTPGQSHESQSLIGLVEDIVGDDGDPMPFARKLVGDKGYRSQTIDDFLLSFDIKPVIPSKSNEDREARSVAFDADAYRERNIVERFIGWLKESRRLFSRFEKTALNFGGMIKLAFIRRYLTLMLK
jgi:transposase